MTVNPDTALNAEREGQTHYFCSEECREQFLSASVVARRTDPCVIVIFGASGDLTSRKLLPSLRNLVASGLLTDDFAIIGVGRTEWSDQDFREQMRSAVAEFAPQKVDPALWENIEERMRYCSGSYSEPETYHRLNTLLSEADASHRTGGNALFYLSVPYTTFGPIAEQLNASGLLNEEPYAWRTIASVWRGWICLHFCRIKPNPKYHRASMPRCLDASGCKCQPDDDDANQVDYFHKNSRTFPESGL